MDRQISIIRRLTSIFLFCLMFIPFGVNAIEQENLPPEKAFTFKAESLDKENVQIQIDIAPGYQLYQEHLKFFTLKGEALQKPVVLPKAITKKDAALGNYEVYEKELKVKVPLTSSDEKQGVIVEYQGCALAGFCYPPVTKQIIASPNGTLLVTNVAKDEDNANDILNAALTPQEPQSMGSTAAGSTADNYVSESDKISNLLKTSSLPITLLAFLGIGILLAFTPCVLPMVPILANILVGQDQPLTRRRSITLAALYVLSMALCYAAAGLAAGLAGSHLQATLQQPVFLVALAILLTIFALSQLNLIHVRAPAFLSAIFERLEQKQNQKQGSAFGAVAMGAVSALMVSPCVTPALVGALTYVGQTGNAILGGLALFVLALGMGLPLLVFAALGSHFLPRAGKWMVYVKNFTGVLLLVLAGSILMRMEPTVAATTPVMASQQNMHQFTTIHTAEELADALNKARLLNKPVILDVYADWCISCKQMEKEVFENEDVRKTLSNVNLLRLDITRQTKANEDLQKELGIIAPPMVLFFSSDGHEVKSYRLAGKTESNNFIDRVKHFLRHSGGTK